VHLPHPVPAIVDDIGEDRMAERRVAVVSGAGTGIGRAIARSYADDGWAVAAVGRRRAPLDALTAAHSGILAIQADLSVPEQVDDGVARIVAEFGTVDVLVANAGGTNHGPRASTAEVAEYWMATTAQNVLTAVLLEHALRPALRKPGGRVVVISSFSARRLAGNPAYGATKAALLRWVMALGDELGAMGCTANAISPGFVPDTELFGGPLDEGRVARISDGIGVRRPGTTTEIANAVRWLASDAASFVNGTELAVDGGVRRLD
jgi:3-oxoacyl-[acyl-carrier protein] reductase